MENTLEVKEKLTEGPKKRKRKLNAYPIFDFASILLQ